EQGSHAGVPFLATAHADGAPLSELLKTAPLPPRTALDLTRQLAEAVAHAHEHGVIHGSLRPAAVWVTPAGEARLSGFGGPVTCEPAPPAAVADFAGSLPPERAGARGAVGKPTDAYGLGALLYFMLTDSPPHQGATAHETFRLIRTVPPVPPSR